MPANPLGAAVLAGADSLAACDPVLAGLLEREHGRQTSTLAMVASCGSADPSVLVCEAASVANTTTEGYPGARYHAGCEVVDEIERLAVDRARALFGARYANVQPASGSAANFAAYAALMRPGDTLLGLSLDAGGHLTHGAKVSLSGRYYRAVGYGVDADERLDYDQVRTLALAHRPTVIVCGASAYPRFVDYAHFRAIADEAGAFLLADISHVAGLVAAGLHPSPIEHAHVTTTSTYKQLFGPRGGLILCGKDAGMVLPGGTRTLADALQSAVFPSLQGTPSLGSIAAKARALDLADSAWFRDVALRIVEGAAAMAESFQALGNRVVTGGTDNHIVLLDVAARGVTGAAVERALEACGIIVNRNVIPGDTLGPRVTSGIRIGTNVLALRGMDAAEMSRGAGLVDEVLCALTAGDAARGLPSATLTRVRAEVQRLCRAFPLRTLEPDTAVAEPAAA
jgi:glycine hydroxymethyltransferase